MGSKNLKAIFINGSDGIDVYDSKNIRRLSAYFKDNFLSNPLNNAQYGPAGNSGYLKLMSDGGMLSAKNFHYTHFEDAKEIDGFSLVGNHKPANVSCNNCFNGCKKIIDGFKNKGLKTEFGLIELESLSSSIYNLLIKNPDAALKIWEVICDYGLDGTSLGVTLGFAVECFENGLVTREDTGGIDLKWGDGESIIELIFLIINKKNIGEILADGVKRAAKNLRLE